MFFLQVPKSCREVFKNKEDKTYYYLTLKSLTLLPPSWFFLSALQERSVNLRQDLAENFSDSKRTATLLPRVLRSGKLQRQVSGWFIATIGPWGVPYFLLILRSSKVNGEKCKNRTEHITGNLLMRNDFLTIYLFFLRTRFNCILSWFCP